MYQYQLIAILTMPCAAAPNLIEFIKFKQASSV